MIIDCPVKECMYRGNSTLCNNCELSKDKDDRKSTRDIKYIQSNEDSI